jgi:hypothetical protein
MLPFKWKIFRVANYVQLIVTVILLGAAIYGFSSVGNTEHILFFMLFCIMPLIIIINNYLNVHVLHSFFPRKIVALAKKKFHQVIFVIYFIISILVVIASVWILIDAFSYTYRSSEWIVFSALSLISLLSIVIVIQQADLYLFLNWHQQLYMQQLVDTIGQTEITVPDDQQ